MTKATDQKEKQVVAACPKCGAPALDREECPGCGLIFTKYERVQQQRLRLAEEEQGRIARRRYRRQLGGILIGIALFWTFLINLLLVNQHWLESGIGGALSWLDSLGNHRPTPDGGAPVTNFIAQARRATVTIVAPTGLGSGFFISPELVVTNRHVIDFSSTRIEKERRSVRRDREIVDLEAQKIEELRHQRRQQPDGPTKKQLELVIEKRWEAYQAALTDLRENERRLADIESRLASPVITVVLNDGTEVTATFIETSSRIDLALIHLPGATFPYLSPPPESGPLKQGDQLYAIGSPKGLVNTVTAGIFSGYRHDKQDEIFLQTDSPINPGNSGGPLIDRFGRVVGITTAKDIDAQGIGFAIPIEAVWDEFDIR